MNSHQADMINVSVAWAVHQAGQAVATHVAEQLPMLMAQLVCVGLVAGFALACVFSAASDAGSLFYAEAKAFYLARRAKKQEGPDAGI